MDRLALLAKPRAAQVCSVAVGCQWRLECAVEPVVFWLAPPRLGDARIAAFMAEHFAVDRLPPSAQPLVSGFVAALLGLGEHRRPAQLVDDHAQRPFWLSLT